jgi:hypothetical protein
VERLKLGVDGGHGFVTSHIGLSALPMIKCLSVFTLCQFTTPVMMESKANQIKQFLETSGFHTHRFSHQTDIGLFEI